MNAVKRTSSGVLRGGRAASYQSRPPRCRSCANACWPGSGRAVNLPVRAQMT